MRALSTIALFFFFFLNTNLQAQTQYDPFFEDMYFYGCPNDCIDIFVFGTDGFDGTYVWYINGQQVQETSSPSFFWCDFFNSGVYEVFVEGHLNDNIVFEAEGTIFVDIYYGQIFFTIDPVNPPPCYETLGPGNVCAGETVLYEINQFGSQDIIEIEWIVEGNYEEYTILQGGFQIEVTWGDEGPGILTAMAYDWCFFYVEYQLYHEYIHPDPEPSFYTQPAAADGLLEICQGETVEFQNTSENATTYSWDFGDGQTSTEENPSYTFSSAGTFEVQLTAFNDCECSETTSLTVVVEESGTPLIDCVNTICANSIATYSSSDDCGTYLWNVSSNGTIIEGGNPSDDYITVNWGDGPEGTVELTLEDCASASACLSTASIQVPLLSENAIIEGPNRVCRGQVTTYAVTPFEGTTFNWAVSNFGTIIAGQGTNSITVEWYNGFEPSETQIVSVSYDNCYLECGGSASLDINFRPSFLASGQLETCENGTTQYTARSSTNNPAAANWSVQTADGNTIWTSGGAAVTQDIEWIWGAGTFVVVATPDVVEDYCTESYEIIVTVQALPETATITGPQSICPGLTYNYQAESGQDGVRFQWVVTNGSDLDTLNGASINVSWGNTLPYELSLVQISADWLACESPATTMEIQRIDNFAISGPIDVCFDQISSFNSFYYPDVKYEWSIQPANAGSIISELDSSSIQVQWHQTGAANLTLSVCGQVENYAVNIIPLPEPVVNHPTDLCPNETGLAQTTTTYSSYEWKNENGTVISTAAQPNLGPGYYQLVVEDENACVGDTTFYINGHPTPKISITTPSPNGYCPTIPNVTFYAVDSEGGYDFQWYRSGTPVGTNAPTHTSNLEGSYYVEVTDQNGCTAISNAISLFNCCGSPNCGGGPPNDGCTYPAGVDFEIQPTADCAVHNFINTSINPISGTFSWYFDDPGSGGNNVSFLDNPTHTFSNPGFYRVIMEGSIIAPSGETTTCGLLKVDTVEVTADFEFDNSCPGGVVEFFDISTFLPIASISAWSWDFGDPASGNNSSTNQNPTHVYANPGTYTVTLTITSSTGCTSTLSRSISIYPPPSVSFDDPLTNCEDVALEFIPNIDASVTYVHWDFGDLASGDANTSESRTSYHRYETPGTYTVTLFVQSIYGCTNSFSQSVTVEANTLAGNINSSLPSPICEGDEVMLTAPAGAVQWEWSTGETNANITVNEANIYEVTLTDADGCIFTPNPFQLDIIPAPDGDIRVIEMDDFGEIIAYYYDNYEICEGNDVFLEVQEEANYSYQWTNGDMIATTDYSDNRGNQLAVGTHSIFVTITDNTTGCSNEIGPFDITIHPLPQNVQINASLAGVICEGTAVTFTVDNPEADLTYVWSNGSTGTSMTTAIAGDYYVTAISPFGCETESNSLSIFEGPDISLVPGGCHYRCAPDTLCLPIIPGVVSYQWYFNDQPIPAPEGTIPNLIAQQSGLYYVEMTNQEGCTLISEPLQLDLFPGFGSIFGNVYFDLNENGVIDSGDTLMQNIPMLLQNNIGAIDTSFSNIHGSYGFINIGANGYTIQIDTLNIPDEFNPTFTQVDTVLSGCNTNIQQDWLIQLECPNIESIVELSFCSGSSATYAGESFTSDTTFTNSLTTAIGCDSTVTIIIEELLPTTGQVELSACTGATANYNGAEIPAGETAEFTFTNVAGCDSTVTVIVEELLPTTGQVELSACTGATANYNGAEIPAGETAEFTFTNLAGCDSTVTVMVEELLPTSGQVELSACSGATANFNGTEIPAGETAEFTFTNLAGCDSTVTVMVEELLPTTGQVELSACTGATANFNGADIPAGETAEFTFTNLAGCDSTVTVMVEELLPTTGQVELSACTGATANYNGADIPAGETAEFTFTNLAGCDSTVTVMVEELLPDSEVVELFACEGTSITYNQEEILAGTQEVFQLTNADGCDSVVTVTVFPLDLHAVQLSFDACTGDSILYNGITLAPNTATDFTFTSSLGCDSTVTVTVVELIPTTGAVQLTACSGQTANYNGTELNAGSTTEFIFTNAVGCDSTVTVLVEELLPTSNQVELEACSGQTATYNGTQLDAGSTTEFTFTNEVGCDSTVTVMVEELLPTSSQVELEACSEQTATYNGTELNAGSTTEFTYTNAVGCDSTVTVLVEELLPTSSQVELEACSGQTVTYNGTPLNAGSSTEFTFTNAVGCDSTVTVLVEELLPTSSQVELEACSGQMVVYNGTPLNAGSTTEFTIANAVGCDSTITVLVEELLPTAANFTFEVCEGETIEWNGNTLEGGTSTLFNLTNAVGCDSVVTVDVDLMPLPSFQFFSQESCADFGSGLIEITAIDGGLAPYLIAFDGGDFVSLTDSLFAELQSGSYWVAIQDANGCTTEQLIDVEMIEPLVVTTENQFLPCGAESIMLAVQTNYHSGLTYLWSDGSTEAQMQVQEPAVYSVEISNSCETVVTNIEVQYENTSLGDVAYIPNAFSPNDDGFNDQFKVELVSGLQFQSFSFYLFDRWGNQVFQGQNPDDGWNGNYRGRKQNTGIYVWHLEATVEYCGRLFELNEKGDVVLMR